MIGKYRRHPAGTAHRAGRMPAVLLLVLSVVPVAAAHDIYTSWTDAHVRGQRLELTFTLARANALRLIADGAALPPVTPENFSDYAPKLKAIAPDLFAIALEGKPLDLTSAEAKVSGDNDVVYHLAYQLPPKPSGTLRIVANYLLGVFDGHVGTIVVMDATGRDLDWSPVSVDQPVFEVKLPPSVTPPKPRSPTP